MPLSSILVVGAVSTAFAVFGLVLAWAERQTRNLPRAQPQAKSAEAAPEMKKAA